MDKGILGLIVSVTGSGFIAMSSTLETNAAGSPAVDVSGLAVREALLGKPDQFETVV